MRPHVVHWLSQFLRPDVAEILAPTWFTCVGLAGLAAFFVMRALGRRRGIDAGTIASMLLWSYTAAVAAGIVVPMVIDMVETLVTTGHLRVRWSGMTSFWGYLAGIGAAVLVCRRDRVPLGKVADLAAIPLGVALVFARLGCFMAGCDYGKVSSSVFAMRFPAGSPAWHDHVRAGLIPATRGESLPVLPTELFEAAVGVAIIAIAVVLGRKLRARREGLLFLVVAATYAIARLCVVEPLRGDAGRGIYAGISSGQIFSLLVLVAVGARIFVGARKKVFATALAAGAFVLCVADIGEREASAQPAPATTTPPPPATVQPVYGPQPAGQPQPVAPVPPPPPITGNPAKPLPPPPVVDDGEGDALAPEETDAQDAYNATLAANGNRTPVVRPHFRVGALFGLAASLNHSSTQIPTSADSALSVGYTPGFFGVWLDLDHFANREANHTSAVASVSYTRRLVRRLELGVRAGLGFTHVSFDAPAFDGVTALTARVDLTAEIAIARNWGIWVRPLTIDTFSAPDLGGAITTYQFRVGFDYRFGFHRTRPLHPPPPQPLPPPQPPLMPGQQPYPPYPYPPQPYPPQPPVAPTSAPQPPPPPAPAAPAGAR